MRDPRELKPPVPPEVIDRAEDGDGAAWRVSVAGGKVRVEADAVNLGEQEQERFAQAYVAACRQAMVNRAKDAGGAVSG